MITRFLFVAILCLSVLPVSADDPAQANRLLVEAVKLIQAAEQEQPASQKLAKLKSALAKLNQIMDDHPSSDVAVKLITDQEIGSLSLPKLVDAIEAAEDRAADQHADQILRPADSREDVMEGLDQIANPEFRQKVIIQISRKLSPRFPAEGRIFYASLIEHTPTRDDQLQMIAWDQMYEFEDYDTALSAVELIESPGERDAVLKEIAKVYARAGDLEPALDLAKRIFLESNRDEVLGTIVSIQLNEDDFEGASSTAELMEEGNWKAGILRQIEEEAYRHDGRLPPRQ